jgi:drug/metabolite transporter (DMT)-like permease
MGGLIALAGVAVSGWPNVFLKTRRQSYDPLTLTAMAMAIGSGIHLIGATVFGEWAKMVWDFKNIGAIVYLGLFGSAIAFFVYYDLLNQISVVKLTFVTFITPVFATLIGAFWLNELVTWREIGGMLLIFAGLVLYDLKKYLAILKQRKGEVAHG